jgi:deoxycytidylate deaminase
VARLVCRFRPRYSLKNVGSTLRTMKRIHEYFFGLCGELASRSHHPQFRHGSIVVHRRSAVIGRGFNRSSLHAEVSSVKNIDNYRRYDNLVVYVCRVNSRGEFMNSKPCTNCMRFMKSNGVSRVYYSDEQGFGKICLY